MPPALHHKRGNLRPLVNLRESRNAQQAAQLPIQAEVRMVSEGHGAAGRTAKDFSLSTHRARTAEAVHDIAFPSTTSETSSTSTTWLPPTSSTS